MLGIFIGSGHRVQPIQGLLTHAPVLSSFFCLETNMAGLHEPLHMRGYMTFQALLSKEILQCPGLPGLESNLGPTHRKPHNSFCYLNPQRQVYFARIFQWNINALSLFFLLFRFSSCVWSVNAARVLLVVIVADDRPVAIRMSHWMTSEKLRSSHG